MLKNIPKRIMSTIKISDVGMIGLRLEQETVNKLYDVSVWLRGCNLSFGLNLME